MSGTTPRERPGRHGAAGEFFAGLWTAPRALGVIIRSRALVTWAAVPVLLTAVLLVALIVLANWALGGWLHGLVGAGESWWQSAVYYLLVAAAVAATVVVGYVAFSAVGILVASLFSDALSARAERACRAAGAGGSADGSAADERFLAGIVRAVGEGLRMALTMLAMQAAVLPLLLVPIVGAAVNVLMTAYLNGVDYLDIVLSRHGFTLSEKKAIIRANRARVLGLGAGLTLSLLFPPTTLLVLPVGVVGGTLVYLDLERGGRLAGKSERPAARGG